MKSANAAYQSERWKSDPVFRLRKYLRDRARILGIPVTEVPLPKPRNPADSGGVFTGPHAEYAIIVLKARCKPLGAHGAGFSAPAGNLTA